MIDTTLPDNFQTPVDFFEINPIWDWSQHVTKMGTCESCGRQKALFAPVFNRCGACNSLARYYHPQTTKIKDGPKKYARFGCFGICFLFLSEHDARIWMTDPGKVKNGKAPSPKVPTDFTPNVSIHYSTSIAQDAFTFIMQDKNRVAPYLFISFNQNRTLDLKNLYLNIDSNFVYVSGEAKTGSMQRTYTGFWVEEARKYANVSKKPADRPMLIENGYSEEIFESSAWRASAIIDGEFGLWY